MSARVLFSTAGLGQTIVIGTGSESMLVDVGDGCLRDLLAADIQPMTLAGITITHGHFDHVGGLHTLLCFLRMIQRKEPLPIIYPAGSTETEAIIATVERCYGDRLPYQIVKKPSKHEDLVQVGPFSVKASAMTHCGSLADGTIYDPIPALGYRISVEQETVAVTGDTGLCDNVRELVNGVDLAIIEATFTDEHMIAAEVLKRVHLSEPVARELAATAMESRLIHKIAKKR